MIIRSKQLVFLGHHYFSQVSDPYYILGVAKQAPFPDIKKAYYKLAALNHPDINKSPSAAKQFILIKQAYEAIKEHKGEAIPMDGEGSRRAQDFKSVRKDSKDYDESWNEDKGSDKDQDYTTMFHKSKDLKGDEYEKMNESLKAVRDILDKNFKPIDMEMPNPAKRFNLTNVMKLKFFSDGSTMYLLVISMLVFFFFYQINNIFNETLVKKYENYIFYLLQNKTIKDEVGDEELIERVSYNLKHNEQYRQFEAERKSEREKAQNKRNNLVPKIQDFISSRDVEESKNAVL